MVDNLPTRGEMERSLSQSILAFYRRQLGCRTEKVSCHIVNQQLSIAIENPISPIEKLLHRESDEGFVSSLRERIDRALKQELPAIIESILNVGITAIAIDTSVEKNFTGIVALLSAKPKVRDLKKTKKTVRKEVEVSVEV